MRASARLRFTRAEGLDTCPTEEEIHGAIVARLGYDPFDGEETAPLLRIRFVRRDRRFAALISRGEDDDIAPTVESASCGELLAPTAIAVSIAIDPLASPSPRETRAHAEAPRPPEATPLALAPAPDVPQSPGPTQPSTPSPWRLRLGLGAQVAVGTAQGLLLASPWALAVAAARSRWASRAALIYRRPRTARAGRSPPSSSRRRCCPACTASSSRRAACSGPAWCSAKARG